MGANSKKKKNLIQAAHFVQGRKQEKHEFIFLWKIAEKTWRCATYINIT